MGCEAAARCDARLCGGVLQTKTGRGGAGTNGAGIQMIDGEEENQWKLKMGLHESGRGWGGMR